MLSFMSFPITWDFIIYIFINVNKRYQESVVVENTVNYAIRQLNILNYFMNYLLKTKGCIFILSPNKISLKKLMQCYFSCTYLKSYNNHRMVWV